MHRYDLRGWQDDNWMDRHGEYSKRWNSRCDDITNAEAFSKVLAYHDSYMVCYRSITPLFLTPHGSFHHILVIKTNFAFYHTILYNFNKYLTLFFFNYVE